ACDERDCAFIPQPRSGGYSNNMQLPSISVCGHTHTGMGVTSRCIPGPNGPPGDIGLGMQVPSCASSHVFVPGLARHAKEVVIGWHRYPTEDCAADVQTGR